MSENYFHSNQHSVLFFHDARFEEDVKSEESNLPAFALQVFYTVPGVQGLGSKTFKLVQPLKAFTKGKLTPALLQQQRLIMSSNQFDLTYYTREQGFLKKQFWIANLFYGQHDTMRKNFFEVLSKLKTEYVILDMLATIKKEQLEQETRMREQDLQRKLQHLQVDWSPLNESKPYFEKRPQTHSTLNSSLLDPIRALKTIQQNFIQEDITVEKKTDSVQKPKVVMNSNRSKPQTLPRKVQTQPKKPTVTVKVNEKTQKTVVTAQRYQKIVKTKNITKIRR